VVTVDGTTYAESGAILEHLADLSESLLRPAAGTEAHRLYRYFMHYAEGSLMAPLLVALITGKLRSAPVPFFLKPIAKAIGGKIDAEFTTKEVNTHMAFLEGEIAKRDYFAGDSLTLADIQMSYPVEAALSRGNAGAYPRLQAFMARIKKRDDYQRALAKGGDSVLIPG